MAVQVRCCRVLTLDQAALLTTQLTLDSNHECLRSEDDLLATSGG